MDYLNNIDILRGKAEYFIHLTGKAMRLKREINIRANVAKEAQLINEVSYAIDELIAGTAPDKNISYILSLIPELDQYPVTPFNPVVLVTSVREGSGAGSGSSVYQESFEVTTTKAGSWRAGDIIAAMSDVRDVVKKMLQETFAPDITAPIYSFMANMLYAVIGSKPDVTLTWTYNPGTTGGSVLGYEYNNNPAEEPTYEIPEYSIVAGVNRFEGEMLLDQGPQLTDSEGEPYGEPLPGGEIALEADIEGVYPFFATTVNTATETQLELASNMNAVTLLVELAPDTELKQRFLFPKRVDRTVNKIEYFNPVANIYDPTNQLADFTLTEVTKTIETNPVVYRKLTYHGPNRGALKVRIYYS